ncbi:SMI1/KNR4 family protein [Lysinibacillus fusiformis]|uniref:SMI1/KNR4 family protein n=1 Tax=Lysinibacillus fusiformis TaxID=28031 RepID=UPI003016DFDF
MHTAYFKNLLQYLPQEEQQQLQKANGATDAQIESLLEIFPQSPQSFIELLQDVNGTYHCKHGEETISVLVLGSDLGDYPYYLKAVEQILADAQHQRETIFERYQDFLEYVDIDKRVNMHVPLNERLCFADCMNNGGTSSLYLDFSPAEGGKWDKWFDMSMIRIALRSSPLHLMNIYNSLLRGNMSLQHFTRRSFDGSDIEVL